MLVQILAQGDMSSVLATMRISHEPLIIGRHTHEHLRHARLSRQHLEVSVHPSEGAHIRVMGKNSVYTDTGQGDCVALKEGDSLVCPHGTTIFLLKDRESGEMILPIRIAPDEVQHPAPSGLSAPTASAQPDVVVLDDSDEEADCIADSSADAAPNEVAGQWSVAPVCTRDAGPAVWHVRRNGRFVAYEAPVQSVIERAWREGLPTAHVRIPAGSAPFSGEFTIDFAALRQVQTADSSRWRPIRRDLISNGADDPLAPVSNTAARLPGGTECMRGVAATFGTSSAADPAPACSSSLASVDLAAVHPPAVAGGKRSLKQMLAAESDRIEQSWGSEQRARATAAIASDEVPNGRPAEPPTASEPVLAPPASTSSSASSQLEEIRKRHAAAFKAREEEVEQTSASTPVIPTAARLGGPLSVLTFNVWFRTDEEAAPSLRMQAIARLADVVGSTRPALLALQELTPSLQGMISPHLERVGYSSLYVQPWSTCGQNGIEPYGVALTTRPPLSPLASHRFHLYRNTMMGRGLLYGTVDWVGTGDEVRNRAGTPAPSRFVVGTTHLESYVGDAEDAIVTRHRRAQLVEAARLLEAEMEARGAMAAVLMGDLNWTDQKDGDALEALGRGWKDAFIDAGRPRGTASTCYSWRFDRCLYLVRGSPVWNDTNTKGAMRVSGVCLAGKEQGPLLEGRKFTGTKGQQKNLYPSDHRGVLVTFE